MAGRRREPEKMPMAALQLLAVHAYCLRRCALPSTFFRLAWPVKWRAGDASLRKCRWRRCSSSPYMHSESTVPAIPGRGYQMMQKPQSGTVNGLSIDVDTTMVDELGGVPQWWVKAGP